MESRKRVLALIWLAALVCGTALLLAGAGFRSQPAELGPSPQPAALVEHLEAMRGIAH